MLRMYRTTNRQPDGRGTTRCCINLNYCFVMLIHGLILTFLNMANSYQEKDVQLVK